MKYFLVVGLAFINASLWGQSTEHASGKWIFGLTVAAGGARFKTEKLDVEDYATLEVRAGGTVSRRLFGAVSIHSGMNFCFRAKRKSYFRNQGYHGNGIPLLFLDDTATKINHTAVEIPVAIGVTLPRTNTQVQGGIMARYWHARNVRPDILQGQTEFGYLIGIQQPCLSNLWLGISFYWGMTNLNHVYVNGANPMRITNQFTALKATYAFMKAD